MEAPRDASRVKRDLTRQLLDERSSGQSKTLQQRMDLFLFRYLNTPTTTTGQTLAEQFLSWSPCTRPTMLQPDLERRMEERFSKVKAQVDERRGSATAPPDQPGDSAPSEQPNASPHQDSAPATSPLRLPVSPLGAQTLRRSARARKPPYWYRP
ncbi:hypothetical protein MRX96_034775 [Rhipicephalus microplus]